jgi:hypothetical protein
MTIRTFTAGDDAAQVSIYNEAAADLPRFKPASLDEIRRRILAADFDPTTRFFAVEAGHTVGYATFNANSRVSFPWCRRGHESHAPALFEAVLTEMRRRQMKRASAAYRGDWPTIHDFFVTHGFAKVREMVNFVIELADMPTPSATVGHTLEPMTPEDVPSVFAIAQGVTRCPNPACLEEHLFRNAYFDGDSAFVMRSRTSPELLAALLLIVDNAYADPKMIDAAMPCFRLGAFGSEGMQAKRVNGLFSFITHAGADTNRIGVELLAQAAARLYETELGTLAAQVPSDAPKLLRYYQQLWRRQGSFPVFEREL